MSQESTIETLDAKSLGGAGLLAIMTVGLMVWGQQGPGFGWDSEAASLIESTIPGLEMLSAWVAWPVVKQWPFAAAVLLTAGGLVASKHMKGALALLGAVAFCSLLYDVLAVLPIEFAPSKETLLYGAFFGGGALALHRDAARQTRLVLWFGAALMTLLPGLALVSTGQLPSAWLISFLLVSSALAFVHMIMD
jgi:hypothetical protein